jgi:hypothetical protein
MSRDRARLALEELGERTLPSVSFGVPRKGFIPPAVVSTDSQPNHSLQGIARGNYLGSLLMVDAGIHDKLTGTADLGKLGSFNLTGWLQGLGNIAHGRASGQLVLSNAQGSITLTLTGPVQPGFSPLPSVFNYQVTAGTGAYSHLDRSGRVHLSLIPAPIAFGLPPQGRFTFTFS